MVTLAPADIRDALGCDMLEAVGIDLRGEGFRNALTAKHIEKYLTGGVRGGKSKCGACCIREDASWHAFLADRKTLLYWVIGPDYEQAHQEMLYLLEMAQLDGMCRVVQWNHPQDGQWTLVYDQLTTQGKTQRVTVETKSAQHLERLGSVAPDGILVVESGQCEEEIRDRCIERASEKGAFIVYSGTLENQELRPLWAWYTENAQRAMKEPSDAVGAYPLPSWENMALYGDCLSQRAANPLLSGWCPDDNHGPQHSGLDHPAMRWAQATLPPEVFDRRFGGKPVGLSFLVYDLLDFWEKKGEPFIYPMPDGLRWIDAAGGEDYGDDHPSALSATTMAFDERDLAVQDLKVKHPRGIIWKRETWFNDGPNRGDPFLLDTNRGALAKKYNIRQWGVDPNEKFIAKNDPWSDTVSGAKGSRSYRQGLLYGRLERRKFMWDARGPGNVASYEETKRVHKYKNRQGQLVYARVEDDRTAADENAVEVYDGEIKRPIPKAKAISYGSGRRRAYGKRRAV